jgi:drug/metabolite transporter (DMT)-like permease
LRPGRPPAAAAYAAVALAAALWGLGGVAGKALFAGGVTPPVLVALRLLGATALLAALLRDRLLPRPAPWGILLALGAALAAVQYTFYAAIDLVGVATAIFLQYTGPAMIAAYLVLRGEPLGWRRGCALGLATAGCFVLVEGGRLQVTAAGLAVGLAAAALLAAHTLLTQYRVAQGDDPWRLLAWSMAVALVLWTPVVPPWRALASPRPAAVWLLVAAVVVLATVVPFGIFAAALRVLDASRASIVAMLEPVVGALGAWRLLGAPLDAAQLAGGALILIAVGVLQAEGRGRRRVGGTASLA